MDPVNPRANENFSELLRKLRPGMAFVVMIFLALVAFEIFNYSTTDHALADLLGDLTFIGVPWSTILALAFCGIDFAGIARLFTPEQGADEPKEVWYLFGAWLLAATMNAILTWWGVSIAIMNHQLQSSAMVDQQTLTNVVPVFVAVMVWVIRILIIGALSMSVDRMLHADQPAYQPQRPLERIVPQAANRQPRTHSNPETAYPYPSSLANNSYNQRPPASRAAAANRPSPRPTYNNNPARDTDDDLFEDTPNSGRGRGEPTYHSLGGVRAKPSNTGGKKLS